MKILSIETSCDETAISLIEASGDAQNPGFNILGNSLFSQVSTHAEYGGVFPMLAKREHIKNIVPLFRSTMQIALNKTAVEKIDHQTISPRIEDPTKDQIREMLGREALMADPLFEMLETSEIMDFDYIAVTEGPGLEPALWVGINFAKALSIILNKPIIPVNHMEGHIVSVLMASSNDVGTTSSDNTENANVAHPQVNFPALALLISGGHTELVLADSWNSYKIIGQTVDDAIGEAFDKVARLLDLPYPGGPKISKFAAENRASKQIEKLGSEAETAVGFEWTLPRPMIKSPDYNFSFSGIKTAVLYAVQKRLVETTRPNLSDEDRLSLAEEFENAVTEVLISKTKRALEETGAKSLIIGGGVIANTYIRSEFEKMISKDYGPESGQEVKLFTPSLDLSTDNSVMIGIAGYMRFLTAQKAGKEKEILYGASEVMNVRELQARGNLSF